MGPGDGRLAVVVVPAQRPVPGGRDYDVQVSDDGLQRRTVVERRGRTAAGVDTVYLPQPVTTRHVRMQGIRRQTAYGYLLHRFEVH
ncbi:discoidin domain-containing protein [Streptomyces sp. NPDC057543]|uniref:discoidin domain-containing protein n=1 Tax=Streptomyces sp. NPDC057543 TaxID=3346163 RepID=UPI003680FAFE